MVGSHDTVKDVWVPQNPNLILVLETVKIYML